MMDYHALITSVVCGIFAGAQLLEARVLVPFWRQLPATDFFRLHHAMGPSLFRFFAPLTVAAAVLPVLLLVADLYTGQLHWPVIVAVFCNTVVVLMFPLFFSQANAEFSNGSFADELLEEKLDRWAAAHRIRTTLAVLAAVCVAYPVI